MAPYICINKYMTITISTEQIWTNLLFKYYTYYNILKRLQVCKFDCVRKISSSRFLIWSSWWVDTKKEIFQHLNLMFLKFVFHRWRKIIKRILTKKRISPKDIGANSWIFYGLKREWIKYDVYWCEWMFRFTILEEALRDPVKISSLGVLVHFTI